MTKREYMHHQFSHEYKQAKISFFSRHYLCSAFSILLSRHDKGGCTGKSLLKDICAQALISAAAAYHRMREEREELVVLNSQLVN